MNNIVPITNAQVPARMRQRIQEGRSLSNNFSDGIRDAYPVLSIKGKGFAVRISGTTQPLVDPNSGYAVPFLDVVLANASKHLAKSFYVKGFSDGDTDAPDCWSLDSIRPDPSVVNKVSPTCQSCPMNAFGSRVTENGKAAKACSDARRVAIVMPHQLGEESVLTMLLRIPQSSLKNLKNYAQLLERHGFEPNGCITRLSFDVHEAYPKLIFQFVSPLTDAEYDVVDEIAVSPATKSMLEAPDFDDVATQNPKQDDNETHVGVAGMVRQAGPQLGAVQGSAAPVATQPVTRQRANTTPVQQKPVQEQAAQQQATGDTIIDLPDGKRFNATKGVFVEDAPAAKQKDPQTIELPGGLFFNQAKGAYVTGPFVGDPVKEAEAPAAPKRTRAKPAEKPAEPKQEPQQEPSKLAVNNEDTGENEAAGEVSDEDVKPGASPTPAGLDALLATLMPPAGS